MGYLQRLDARLTGYARGQYPRRSYGWPSDDLACANFLGTSYPLMGLRQTIDGHQEPIAQDFVSLTSQAMQSNGVVFACMLARQMIFSEARFQFRRLTKGRPGDLFGTPALDILERPWPGGVTGDLLSRAIQSVDLSGNAFIVRRGSRLVVVRPDWMTIVLGSMRDPDIEGGDLDAEVLGYVYEPGGRAGGRAPVVLDRSQVAHFAPTPDPLASFRGMSWLTPIIREVMGDSAATTHKLKFFENGATPNMVVALDPAITGQAFDAWVDTFEKGHKGLANAYRTLYLGAGAKAEVVGGNLQQLDFKAVQGAGETRIAAAAGIHPVIVGLSEGLAGSSLNAGNFNSARRLVADRTMRPLWRNIAGSLEVIVPPPGGAQLWYDDRDIAFLREDRADAANIVFIKSQTIRQLVDGGFDPESVVSAVEAEDMNLLTHTGLTSVQLNPPNDGTEPPAPEPDMPAPMPTPPAPQTEATK
jgi:phage portal protein BeeE